MLDPISEMLTRIKNAQMAGKGAVIIGASKLKFAVAKILESEGFVESVEKIDDDKAKIKIVLKYYVASKTRKIPAIRGIKRISRESQRFYVKNKEIQSVKNNFGVAIISTSKGVMTGYQSKKLGLGGEYICQVW